MQINIFTMFKKTHLHLLYILLLPASLIGCKNLEKAGPIQYEFLQVERQGSGQLDFRVYPGDSRSNLNIYVSRIDYQNEDKRFKLQIEDNNVDVFDDFYKALNGQIPLKGKQDASTKKLKGSWLYLRFVRGNTETDITNPYLLQQLTYLEYLVRKQINIMK